MQRIIKFDGQKVVPSETFDQSLFDNISWSYFTPQTHQDVAAALKNKNPYTITVLIEPLKYEFCNKKEYVKKTETQIGSKYRELLYEYFYQEFGRENENEIYGQWLDKYRPLHDKEKKYEFVDEYIIQRELEPRYKAKILKRFKNHEKLFGSRVRIERSRYYNLPDPLNYIDYRNPFDNIFIWTENGKKEARRGGSGASGSRETNSKFVFGLLKLNKVKPVPSYIFIYSEENKLLFVKKFDRLCVPLMDVGSNYQLGRAEEKELRKSGLFLRWDLAGVIKEIKVQGGLL